MSKQKSSSSSSKKKKSSSSNNKNRLCKTVRDNSTTDLTVDSVSSRISFGEVQVRDYERIVGDHPDTRFGVPLSIGWAFAERDSQHLDEYEKQREEAGPRKDLGPVGCGFKVDSSRRKKWLKEEFGISDEEVLAGIKQAQESRKKREYSNKQSKVSAKFESAMISARRKLRCTLTGTAY